MTTATKYKTYPTYKPSGIDWLGDIPDGWEVKRLKYGFYFTKGKNAALYTAEYNAEHAGDYPVYSGQTEGEGVMGLIDSYDYDFEKVIFTTTVGAKVMTPLLLSGKFSLSQNCLLMIKSLKQVDEKYFYYQLFPLFDREKSLVPSHMQPSLRFSDLNTFDVAYPGLDEQKNIVTFLDRETAKIDKMVAKKQKMMALLKEKRQALITHAVTKGLDPKAKMKPSGTDWLGDIPDNWEAKRLRYFFDYHAGGVWGDEEKGDQNDLICLRVADFDFDHFGLSDTDLTTRNIPENQHSRILEKGDILLEKSGGGEKQTVGRAVRFDSNDRAVCSNFIEKLTPLKVHNSKYISYLMGALYFGTINVRSIKQTTGIQNLDIYAYFSEVVPFPEKSIQKSIADFLDRETTKIDEMMKKVEMQIEKLQEYRQALITNAVTGKIMVN